MSFLHHPAFQSLALPLVLTLAATLLLGASAGKRWASLGGAVGLLVAFSAWPGFDWPAMARVQKLPWIVMAGGMLAVLLARAETARHRGWLPWLGGVLVWAAASAWLAGGAVQWLPLAASTLGGAAVLALLLLDTRPWGDQGVAAAAALGVAALGLAALAALGGSLLLAQLAVMLGVAAAMPGLWAWLAPRSGMRITPAALLPLGLAWLAIAQSLAAPGGPGAARLGLLALAFGVPPLLTRTAWAARHPWWVPVVAALLAAVPVLLVLVGSGLDGMSGPAGETDDDPYYQPAWK